VVPAPVTAAAAGRSADPRQQEASGEVDDPVPADAGFEHDPTRPVAVISPTITSAAAPASASPGGTECDFGRGGVLVRRRREGEEIQVRLVPRIRGPINRERRERDQHEKCHAGAMTGFGIGHSL